MKKSGKIIASALAAAITLSSFAGCGTKDLSANNPSKAYYANSTGEFLTYGYHPPTDGSYRIDSDRYQTVDENGNPVDFRTEERYKEYLDAGLNLLFIQGNDGYSGYDFENSQLKKNMDNAYAAGLKKVSVHDTRLYWPSTVGDSAGKSRVTFGYLNGRDKNFVIPEGKLAADVITDPDFIEEDYDSVYKSAYGDKEYAELSDEEKTALKQSVSDGFEILVKYAEACLAEYKAHPAFYGVMLVDEPTWYQLPQTCLMVKAVRKASNNLGISDMFIQVNLLPMDTQNASGNYSPNKDKTDEAQYEEYVETYAVRSGEKRIGMDVYPMRETKNDGNSDYTIFSKYYVNLKVLERVAKKYGCSLAGVAQSCELTKDKEGNTISFKAPNESDMYWQLNSYMGFGFTEFSYYVYWSKQDNAAGGYHTDGTMFITHDGERTPLYYQMQKIHAEMQRFAPIMLNFDYQGFNYYTNGRTIFQTTYLSACEADKKSFDKLESVSVGESQIAVVTELLDEAHGQYMYMLMNPNAPCNEKKGDASLKATLKFSTEYDAAEVWYKGEMLLYPLDKNGEITFDLSAGYAVYVMPYKA